jgi:hypothetical protein
MYSKWVSAGAHRAPNLGVLIRKSAPTSAYDPARARICCPLDFSGAARMVPWLGRSSNTGPGSCRVTAWSSRLPAARLGIDHAD